MSKLKSVEIQGYRIRASQRAKHVSIKVSHLGEVEIVIPQGFDVRRIPEIVEKRQDWIAKTTRRLRAERQALPQLGGTLPEHISLQSITENWSVKYRTTPGSQIIASVTKPHHLLISGQIDNIEACRQGLRRWLSRKAQIHLIPWLKQVSRSIELPCNQVSVRGQKTLWASCSSQKNISLNYKLLFLPPRLVHYVFVHELCHTIHLNHSSHFWSLVAEKEPDYRRLDQEVGKAWCYVPEWVERSQLE